MSTIGNKQIQDWLDSGRRVVSQAAGRCGVVTGVSHKGVHIRSAKPGFGIGITTFEQGDSVDCCETINGCITIFNVMQDEARQ